MLQDLRKVSIVESEEGDFANIHSGALRHSLHRLFPQLYGSQLLKFVPGSPIPSKPLVVGVVLSGGQAPGGHNVIAAVFDALKAMNPQSVLLGFRNGPAGIVNNKVVRLEADLIDRYRNTGGFDMIGSGRTKISSPKQFEASVSTVEANNLDGLIIIGGDDSNTNAALLAEYFLQQKLKCRVVGVPKTIDGDLSNEYVEISFGYDTACKTYANEIGALARDCCSAGKYWFFVKLMGRSASHITLECALQTRPNVTLISEEVLEQRLSLNAIVSNIADVVCARAKLGKDYGMVLIPEGLIEFIPEFQRLIADLNRLMSAKVAQTVLKVLKRDEQKVDFVEDSLAGPSKECYAKLPLEIRVQLILDRDDHGNVSVSQIETEKLVGEMVGVELARRHKAGTYTSKFDARFHFCGYQGRSVFPSNFDSNYCSALGYVAAKLIEEHRTGYLACVRQLGQPLSAWEPCAVPLTGLMGIEERHGENTAVIRKALVDLRGRKFKLLQDNRPHWMLQDAFCFPGSIQFHGPSTLTDESNFHVRCFRLEEARAYSRSLAGDREISSHL